jgi:hypothetical protein
MASENLKGKRETRDQGKRERETTKNKPSHHPNTCNSTSKKDVMMISKTR